MKIETFIATQADQLEEVVNSSGWDLRYVRLNRGSFEARYRGVETERGAVCQEHFAAPLQVIGPPRSRMFSMGLPVEPAEGVSWHGRVLRANELVLGNSGVDLVTRHSLGLYSALYPRERVLQVARKLGLDDHEFDRAIPPSVELTGPQATALRNCFRGLMSEARHSDTRIELESSLLAWVCTLLTGTDSGEGRHSASTRARCAKTVQEYVEENMTQPLRIEELCSAVGFGIRTVQRSFREVFGMTPLAYMKARRLDEIRRQLRQPSQGLTITSAARSNGYSHLSRFAGEYQSMFSESPRDTLRRR